MKLLFIVILILIAWYCIKNGIAGISKGNKAREIGKNGEDFIAKQLLAYGLATKKHIRVYRNAYVTFKDGRTTEIDILALTNKYLYVIESKNYNGQVYVDANAQKWNVNYANGATYTMYNPLLQNQTHIKALKNILGIPESNMKSVVAFGKDTILAGTESIENVVGPWGLIKFIEKTEDGVPDLAQSDIEFIDKQINKCLNKDIITKIMHIVRIKIENRNKRR